MEKIPKASLHSSLGKQATLCRLGFIGLRDV